MLPDMQPGQTLHRIRAITLDLDDTLWAINPVIYRAEEQLWAWLSDNYPKISERFSISDMLTLRQEVVEEYWEQSHDFRFLRKKVLTHVALQAGYSDELVEPAFAVFDEARNDVELFPDVLHELEWLYENYTVVAVTNGNANLETIGIRHLFHGVVTATSAGAAKPAPRIFEVAVNATGHEPHEILHVGDHPDTDVGGAQRAGLRTAWINRNGDDWPDSLDAPDAIVTTMTEIRALLEAAGAAS